MGWRERNRPEGNGSWYRSKGEWHFLESQVFMGSKRGGYCWIRSPRTTQEMRMWDGELGRWGRSPRRLPDAWYDEVGRHVERSWKRHRRTQYRAA